MAANKQSWQLISAVPTDSQHSTLPKPSAAPGHPSPTKPIRQPLEAANNPAALLRLDTVMALTGLGRSSVYARIARNEFPPPIRQGKRCSRWRAESVVQWLESVK